MRLKVLTLLVILSQISLLAQAQDVKITLAVQDVSLKEVLKKIEKQVDYTFLYNDVKIDVNQLISVTIESDQIKEVMDAVLLSTNINYVINGKQIVLSNLEISNPANAQKKRTIEGVISTKTGETLPGVNIIINGTTTGTVSDLSGKYSIVVDNDNAILVFSYIGYNKQEITVKDQKVINVVLEESYESLNQLVVIGYGTIKKSDLTGAVSSVKSEDLVVIPSSNVENALAGKVSGLQVSAVSGMPGSTPVLRLRGVGTINNSSPIFVVDGVILDDIDFLNPSDVESVEVLKDASSTSIYGSRGANGVIIVTTKIGVRGGGQKVNFSYSYGSQYLPKKIDLLNGPQFATVANEINPGTFNNIAKVDNTDWQDLIFQEFAPINIAQLSLSGSVNDKYQYYFGLSYFDQQGVIEKSSYKRFSIKMNHNYFITKKIQIGSNLTISPDKTTNSADVVPQAYRAWPTSVPFNDDGSFAEVFGSGNPLASIEYFNGYTKKMRGVGSFFGDVDILKNLHFKSSIGFDLINSQSKNFTPVFHVSPLQENITNDLNVSTTNSFLWIWENILTYNYNRGNHKLNVLGGYTMQKIKNETLGGSVENLIGEDESLWYLNAGETSTQRNYNSGDISSIISYLFRTNYTLRDKYLFTFSVRADGSSKFNKENRWGYFPSVAVGWNIANEDFFPAKETISTLKLRSSWGMTGNEKTNYNARFPLVVNQQNAIFGVDEELNPGATLGNTADRFLKWESTSQIDIGLEIGLFDEKYSAQIDFFSRETSDILTGIPTPGYIGNGYSTLIITNAGSVLNTGIEFALSSRNEIARNWTLNLNANGTFLNNKVLSLGANSEDDDFIQSGGLGNGQLVTRTQVGQPIGSFYGYKVIGVLQNQEEVNSSAIIAGQQPGDLKFADLNGDGYIDDQDRTFIGSPIPDFMYGFSANLIYKNFYLTMDFYGQVGNEIYNGKNAVRPDLYNFEARVNDRWHGEGTSNTEPRATSGGVNYEPSEYFIEDGSFFRLRTLTLGYEFNEKLLSRVGVDKMDVYARATNLFTLTKFSGYSPEIGGEDVLSSGIDKGIYPITAIISIGLNLIF